MSITNLLGFKKQKFDKRILQDIDEIIIVLEKIQLELLKYKMYKPVQELISIVETNKVLFNLKKKAHEKNSIDNQS